MHTVVETPAYLAAAAKAGMSAAERTAAVELIAANPDRGDLIAGGGGVRKVRVPGRGKGKSGGYRIITYFMREDRPVYLLSVLSKGSRATFSAGQTAVIRDAAKAIRHED